MLGKIFRNRIFRAPLRAVEKPVFVVGGVRTGSTYLTHLLNCHPNLVLGVEDRLPRLLLDILAIVDTPPGSVRYRELSTDPEKLQQIGHEGVLGFHEQPDLLRAFRSLFEARFKELLKDFYGGPRAMALQQQLGIDKTGAGRWGDKLGTFWPGELLVGVLPGEPVCSHHSGRTGCGGIYAFVREKTASRAVGRIQLRATVQCLGRNNIPAEKSGSPAGEGSLSRDPLRGSGGQGAGDLIRGVRVSWRRDRGSSEAALRVSARPSGGRTVFPAWDFGKSFEVGRKVEDRIVRFGAAGGDKDHGGTSARPGI